MKSKTEFTRIFLKKKTKERLEKLPLKFSDLKKYNRMTLDSRLNVLMDTYEYFKNSGD